MTGHRHEPQPRCGYCGRFMRTKDWEGWDTEPFCARTDEHILADPEHWSIDVENVVLDDGVPYTGHIGAHHLTTEQLRSALGLPADPERPAPCREAYPNALKRGEVWECEKTGNRWKHKGHDHWIGADGEPKSGVIQWWGRRLDSEEQVEADRIRALGGIDEDKRAAWVADLAASLENGGDR